MRKLLEMILAVILILCLSTGPALASPVAQAAERLGNFTGPASGTAPDDNVKASLDLIRSMVAGSGSSIGTGNAYYVDSNVASEGDGTSWTAARDTLDEAVGLCTANNGDIIYVAPGHAETLAGTADSVDVDVAGVTIIGIGNGEDMPEFTYDTTTDEFVIGAANVTIVNLRFIAGVSAITMGISVEAGGDNFTMLNCIFPKPTTNSWEFNDAIDIADGANNITIRECEYYNDEGGAAPNHFIEAGNGSAGPEKLQVIDCYIKGDFAVSAIWSDEPCDEAFIVGNTIINHTSAQHCIEFTDAGTGVIAFNKLFTDAEATTLDPGSMYCFENYVATAINSSGVLYPAADDTATNFIGVDNNNNAAATTNVAANADGSILERLEQIDVDTSAIITDTAAMDTATEMQSLTGTANVSTTGVTGAPTANTLADTLHKDGSFTYDNTTDSLEAIADALAAGTGCTTAIVADDLDHLVNTAAGTDVYPVPLTTDSIIAMMMCKGAAATASTYNNTTDSLEALADTIALVPQSGGTTSWNATALAAIEGEATDAIEADVLDKLAAADDSAGATAYPDSVAQDSILAYIMASDASPVVTGYDNTTDSLEAIADRAIIILADTITLSGGTLPASPSAGSLADFISSGTGSATLGTNCGTDKSIIDAIGSDGAALLDVATGVAGIIGIPTDASNACDSSTITADEDGSVFERLEQLQANQTPRMELKNNAAMSGYDTVAWFTVTGDVKVRVVGVVGDTQITCTSGTTTLSIGTTEDADAIIAATAIDGADFDATDVWVDNNPEDDAAVMGTTDWVIIGGGADIILTRNVDDLTAGKLTLYCWWVPLSADGDVTPN